MGRKKTITVDPNPTDDKQKKPSETPPPPFTDAELAEANRKKTALDNVEPPKKRERVSWKKQAETLQTQLDAQKVDVVKTTPEQMKFITDGLFTMVEGMLKLPLTQVDPKLKSGFDEAAAICMDAYVAPSLGKWQPLIQLGTMAMLITAEAIRLKGEQTQKKLVKSNEVLDPVES